MDEKVVYIVLSMSGTRFSRFLRLFSRLEFTHASLSFEEDLNTLYSFGRKKVRMPWIAGFTIEHPNTGIFGLYDADCEILELKLSEEDYNSLRNYCDLVLKNKDFYRYNFTGLLYTYFNRPKKLRRKYTCTQFVAATLNRGAHIEFDKDVSLVLPSDYYKLPCKSVYKGKLHSFVESKR